MINFFLQIIIKYKFIKYKNHSIFIITLDEIPRLTIAKDSGIVISFKEEHPLKQLSPREFTEGGIVKLTNDEHPQKAFEPIDVNEEGKSIDDNEEQPLNSPFSIDLIEGGIETRTRDEQPQKTKIPRD